MNIAVIGAGSMGSQHARVIAASQHCSLGIVVDRSADAARALADRYGSNAGNSLEDIAGCSGAIVATPTETHLEIALELIDRGMPLLVEKPLAQEPSEVNKIIEAATEKGVPLMCGFVERFNPAFTSALELLDQPVRHITLIRHSPKTPTAHGDVVADVAIHDVDLALRIIGGDLQLEGAAGWSSDQGTPEIVDCALRGAAGAVVSISANRWSQTKRRLLTIDTDSQTLEVDLMRQNVTVYRHVSHEIVGGGGYRAETVVDIPFIRHSGEPLVLQLKHFTDLIKGGDAEAEATSILPPHRLMSEIRDAISGPR